MTVRKAWMPLDALWTPLPSPLEGVPRSLISSSCSRRLWRDLLSSGEESECEEKATRHTRALEGACGGGGGLIVLLIGFMRPFERLAHLSSKVATVEDLD